MTKHELIEKVRVNVLAFTDAGPRAAFVVEKIIEAAEEYAQTRVEEAKHPSLFGEVAASPAVPPGAVISLSPGEIAVGVMKDGRMIVVRKHLAGIRDDLKNLVRKGAQG